MRRYLLPIASAVILLCSLSPLVATFSSPVRWAPGRRSVAISTGEAECFRAVESPRSPLFVPNPRGGETAMHAANNSSTNDSSSKKTRPLTKFLTLFFKGVTLPFPTLRDLVDSSGTTDIQSVSGEGDQDDKKKKNQIGFSVRESVLAIVVYLLLGVVSYSSTMLQKEQAWSLVDALYFGVVTFTSVGYGDLCPTTTPGKMFTILFGLSGISILGAAIATIGSRLVERENDMIQAAQDASRKRVLGVFHSLIDKDGDDTNSTPSSQQERLLRPVSAANNVASSKYKNDGEDGKKTTTVPPLWRQTIQNLLKKSIPAFFALVVGGAFMGRLEGWSMTDSIYYSFITAGTLGYGDFSPMTRRGRIWGVVFIPLAVAAAGEVLGNVASALLERRQERFYEGLMGRELNMDRLLEMDNDNNGQVSREEYVEFMLKEMQLVSDEQFEELHDQFKRLDADGGGYLDRNDLRMKMSQDGLKVNFREATER